jgi:hypothetical protein
MEPDNKATAMNLISVHASEHRLLPTSGRRRLACKATHLV